MAVKYVPFDGELVSMPWAIVLGKMRADGVSFSVSEGHRTMARQQFFWNCWVCKCCNNGNLAAFPSHTAPHIKTGHIDHAVDFGGDLIGVLRWLERHGLKPRRTAGAGTSNWEPWHFEVDTGALRVFANRHGPDKWDTLPKHVEAAVRKLIFHRHGAKATKGKKPKQYRKHVRWRKFWRKRVEGMLRRSRKPSTRRLLRQALKH
jgi:hypothetical protein